MTASDHHHVRSYRREWARRLIRRGNTPANPPPAYGSAAWCALPESHPAKIASVVLAAESWAWGNDVLAARDRVQGARHGTAPGDTEHLHGPVCWDWSHALDNHHQDDVDQADDDQDAARGGGPVRQGGGIGSSQGEHPSPDRPGDADAARGGGIGGIGRDQGEHPHHRGDGEHKHGRGRGRGWEAA
ncbi:hypothetical protein AB0I72_02055 [Nocardiopsis sp. NPDC049922]|uniref:hypothetical protein n=1 Tax=Nocardiopsis sp. NPDC049922 TaxID=3155157 RepID=UPI0033C61386